MNTPDPIDNFQLDSNATLWDSTSISEALGLDAPSNLNISSVSIDSRTLSKGALFIAIQGEQFDGNDYVVAAIENGAELALVSKVPTDAAQYQDKFLVVEDTFVALNQLATYARNRLAGKLVGITGSVGKTSTKEMLKKALEHQGKIYASKGNFNNHYGMPLTLANMPQNTDFAVIEMGMSAAGEISHLSNIAKPDIAIITTVEAVHLEFFSSVSGIAAAKAEIFDGMQKEAIAILNLDNPYHKILDDKAKECGLKTITFGENSASDYKLLYYRAQDGVSKVIAECAGKDLTFNIGAIGKHHALNSLAVLAAVKACGQETEFAGHNLRDFASQKGRGKISSNTAKDLTIIDDTYNAGPASVKSALTTLGSFKTAARRVAILGDMKELGEQGPKLHSSLFVDVANNNVDKVHTVGELMHNLHESLPESTKGIHVANAQELLSRIDSELSDGDVILVKGSNSMKMDLIVDELLK